MVSRSQARQPESILVYVGTDRIGDGTMKLPFIYGLRAAFPAARITWLAGLGPSVFAREIAPLVSKQIDEVVENANIGLGSGELVGPRPLPGRRFDLIIDTQRRVRTTLILRRIRHRAFVSGSASYLLSDFGPKPFRKRWRKPPSVNAQLRILLEAASGREMAPMTPLPRQPEVERALDALLPPGARYVGLVPGAGGRHKCWPLDRFLDVARDLVAQGYTPVFILGPDEESWAETVRAAVPEALLPLQAAEEITPLLTIGLAHRLAVAVSNDCGTGHLLAAADMPLVSLFGPTPPEKFAPATSKLLVVQAQQWGGEAMELIPTEAVRDALQTQLNRYGDGTNRPPAATR